MNGIGDFVASIKETQRLAAQIVAELKGEAEGHPFRGNQFSAGEAGTNLSRVNENHPHAKRINEIVSRHEVVKRVLAGKVRQRERPLWEREKNNLEYEHSTLIDDEGPSK